MHIKSIVLDGFKSYGNRVEITGFDHQFNAITGLNGTGKSNILDSICFVLGITNLSNVRAGSLQELIYKHGQAGITKATVSVTFDNRDKKQCPIGYENHDEITVTRQVVMGGKNKYLINGINVQNKRVSDLFCSVQLNVNNPHFLIMQGRITKVLNMKPPEILSMVEEAAGTRMYEAKKQAAQKTIEKKDAKLRELNDIIKEDIAPKLQKLQDERSQFQEYQKVVRELENLTRLHTAWKFVTAEEKSKEAEEKVKEVQNEIQRMKDKVKENEAEMKSLDKQVSELNKKLDEESGSILKQLESELSVLEKEEATKSSEHKAAKDALDVHEKKIRLTEKALKDDEKALAEKEEVLSKTSSCFTSLKDAADQAEAAREEAAANFLAVSTGLETGAGSLQDQLMAAKQEASEASTIVSQSSMEQRHLEQKLQKLKKECSTGEDAYKKDQREIQSSQAEIDKLQAELSRLQYSEAAHSQLTQQTRTLQQAARGERDRAERLASRLQRCGFTYSDPEPGFDRRRVHGTVAKLITVPDLKFCTALETVAGGKLYNVVVDNEATSKALLQRGKLTSRTTIIPLNKISGSVMDDRTLRVAQEQGGGPNSTWLALNLVQFPQAVSAAMRWVFGNTLVCRDLATARRVAFCSSVRRRAVTLDGDVVDPAGTLSGGARLQGGSVLAQLAELAQLEATQQAQQAELAELIRSEREMQAASDRHATLQNKYEMMRNSLEILKSRVASTTHGQAHEELQQLEVQLEELRTRVQQEKARQQDAAARAKDLEIKLKDIKGHREREFKKAEAALKKTTSAASSTAAAWRARSDEAETLTLQRDELRTAVMTARDQLTRDRAAAQPLRETLGAAAEQAQRAKDAVKEIQNKIKRQKTDMSKRSGEVSRLIQQKEALSTQNGELKLKAEEKQYSSKELQQEAADCQARMGSLLREHAWISTERSYFGLAGGPFDFTGRSAGAAGARVSQLTTRRDKLARGLNARAHTLLTSEEDQYQDVLRKKKIVEADRAKLVQVMSSLDEKKRQTLVTACHQVNKDFGSIFSTLLPGAQARLSPPPGLSVLDGLEVKVGFNGTWKESLGELSGGQRSLVALALVLAMLLFKPAPLYILDEVDAALDLSHTQNIGLMLHQHFKHSQFIVVSLKDGMFNNANVLFRTKFVDGMSSVQRTVNPRR